MLDTRPGDMFILRNVGNFIPPYRADNDYHGSSAVIEYAVSILGVKHIIVCGHSHCGACKSLYQDIGDSPDLIHVKNWFDLGKEQKSIHYLLLKIKMIKKNFIEQLREFQ